MERDAVLQLAEALAALLAAPKRDIRLLTVPEAAERLRISKSKLYQLISTGRLPSVTIDGAVRVLESDLEDYVLRNRRARLSDEDAAAVAELLEI